MIRVVLYLMMLLTGTLKLTAQTGKYETGMQKALELWSENKTDEASNTFERIAKAEKENWIPYYYVAFVNITRSFGEKDARKLALQLKKAEENLEEAKLLSTNNPEILVMEAMMNTAWVAFDGATYGMTLSGKNAELYQQALQISPENPRVVFSKAEWDMGSARYFGKDTSPYCKDVKKAIELFATFKNETPFYPSWGKERAEKILEGCK